MVQISVTSIQNSSAEISQNIEEMAVDFLKQGVNVPELFIDDVKVECVSEYKYLDIVLEKNSNINFLHKKCQSRI